MVLPEEHGTEKLRVRVFDGIVKGFALASYKFKQAVSVVPTKAWINFFFRESPDTLTGVTTTGITSSPIMAFSNSMAIFRLSPLSLKNSMYL